MNKLRTALTFFALTFFACQTAEKAASASLILTNGNFWTADPKNPKAAALVVGSDGKILFVGDEEGALAYKNEKTEVRDLGGAFAMPGLIEGHAHFSALGKSLQNLNLLDSKSWQEIVAAVAEKAKTVKAGDWIEGRGWHQEKWVESAGATVNGYPFNDLLSAAAPQNPVVLFHASGHGLIANEKAMTLAGISRESADVVGGRIVRDASGRAIGVFEENAMAPFDRLLEEADKKASDAERFEKWTKQIQLAENESLKYGITSFHDAGAGFEELGWMEKLAEKNALRLRVWAMISAPDSANTSRLSAYPKIGLGNDFLTIRAVKGYFDGALGSFGAWLLKPYNDKKNHFGQNTTSAREIARVAAACEKYGLQFCVHAIGDRANRETLNIFEQKAGEKGLRWRIEHAQHLDTADIKRFAKIGAIASMQSVHCTSDAPFVVKRLGEQRAKTGAYAWRSLLDAGAAMANGTDAPVESVSPMATLFAAVTRKRADGSSLEFFPEQKMTRDEALRSLTIWNAFAAFEEGKKGSLEVGKWADVAVFSKNLLECEPSEILKTEAIFTIIGGKLVFSKR